MVVTLPEFGQASSSMLRVIVQTPVHFFGLERPMKSFQQAQLRRRTITDANVAVLLGDELHKPFGDERRTVVGDQKRRLLQRTVDASA